MSSNSLPATGQNVLSDFFHSLHVQDLVSHQQLVSVRDNQGCGEAVAAMSDAHVSCLPIVDHSTGKVVSQIDMLDVLAYVASVLPDTETVHHDPKNALAIAGRAILFPSVMEVADKSGRDPFTPVFVSSPASSLSLFFAQGMHRAVVVDHNNTCVGVVSQMSICEKLADALQHKLKEFGAKSFAELHASDRTKISAIKETAKVVDAIKYLAESRLSALAVVDPQSGRLTANFSAVDLDGIYHQEMPQIMTNIREYLEKFHPQSLAPVVVRPETTLSEAVSLIVNSKVHRAWVVDNNFCPVSCFSLTDVFKLATLPELF